MTVCDVTHGNLPRVIDSTLCCYNTFLGALSLSTSNHAEGLTRRQFSSVSWSWILGPTVPISEDSVFFSGYSIMWRRSTGLQKENCERNTRPLILPCNLERLEWDLEIIIIHSCHLLWEDDGFQKGAALQYRRVIVKVFVPHVRISPRANYFLRAPLPASFTFWDTHIHQCVWISQPAVIPLLQHFGWLSHHSGGSEPFCLTLQISETVSY